MFVNFVKSQVLRLADTFPVRLLYNISVRAIKITITLNVIILLNKINKHLKLHFLWTKKCTSETAKH
jgi:hypothetical protein